MFGRQLCLVLRVGVCKKPVNCVKNVKIFYSSCTAPINPVFHSRPQIYQSNYKHESWSFRSCSTSTPPPPILHVQYENDRAHSVIQNNPKYASILAPGWNRIEETPNITDQEFEKIVQGDWASKSIQNLCDDFRTVSLYVRNLDIDISDCKFDNLCLSLVARSTQFDYDQMCNILYYLKLWKRTPTRKSHNYFEVWSALDKACVSHINDWDYRQLLKLCSCWYHLNLGGLCTFNFRSSSKISRRVSRLTQQELVLMLFYFNLRRSFPSVVDVYDYQVAAESLADELSLDELGICAMGFFKTQKAVRSPRLLQVMLAKATEEASTAHPLTLAAILKIARISLPVELADQMYNLLHTLLPRIPELPLVCCLHIALAGTNLQMCHEKVINAVLTRFFDDLPSARLKDLERICFILSLYNWPSTSPSLPGVKNIYRSLLDEVMKPERDVEIDGYPRCLANILNFLSISGTYDYPAINRALSADFISQFFSLQMQKSGLEIASLDVAVEIECPDYKGTRLSEKSRRFVSKTKSMSPHKWQDNDILNGSQGDKILKEIIIAAQEVTKHPSKVFVGHILPNHFRPDILLRVKEDDPTQFLPIPDSILADHLGKVRRPSGEGKFICFVLAGWNLLLRNSGEPTGLMVQKLRLLSTLGYNPVLIKWNEWRSTFNRKEIIQQKINEVLADSTSKKAQRSF